MLDLNKIYNIDCLQGLKLLEDDSVDCCVTSPPYWAVRDYGLPPTKWPQTKFRPNFLYDFYIKEGITNE